MHLKRVINKKKEATVKAIINSLFIIGPSILQLTEKLVVHVYVLD
jgi:hypothetical protein